MVATLTPASQSSQSVDLSAALGLANALWASGASLDSRAVQSGDVFVALQGASGHGLSFLSQAVANGAVAVLLDADDQVASDQQASLELPAFFVTGLKSKLALIARTVYGAVDQELALVGVTGTDGKTSITHFIAQLLGLSQASCAVLGTVGNGFIGQLKSSTHTTGDVFQIYRQLAAFHREGARAVAMEVSSHALHQDRVAGLSFKAAVLSNLGRDHLDYHGSVENYAAAKALLFDQRAEVCVLNHDDAFARQIMTGRPDAVSYSAQGHSDARWSATDCVYSANGIACRIHCADFSSDVQLSVLGAFNVANVLAACAVAEALGETPASIVARLPQLKTVIGRAELLSSEAGAKVVIDYAHTAQALAAILKTMREHFPARIWCVFGCGGDRDRSKRAEMAKAAFQGADCVVVTSDNPRSEDPQQIIDDVLAGLPTTSNVHAEVDRASAIAYALSHAAADDCVLIAGKGHEDYQVLAERTVAFSDHAEVMRWQAGAS